MKDQVSHPYKMTSEIKYAERNNEVAYTSLVSTSLPF